MENELFSMLVTQTWQVTLLAFFVWGLTRAFANDRPHLAHTLWMLVLIKCITPPVFCSPTSPFCWFNTQPTQTTVSSNAAGFAVLPSDEFGSKSILFGHSPLIGKHENKSTEKAPYVLDSIESTITTHPPEPQRSTEPAFVFNWQSTISWTWMIGALIGILVTTIRFCFFLAWIKRSQCNEDKQVNQTIDKAAQQLSKRFGVRRRVRIQILDQPVGPAVMGIIRPTILLPKSLVEGKTSGELEPLLAHELIHIRRGDLWWAMIQTIATSLFWFHPLVWLASRMATRESERSCDEETVMSLGCQPVTYARGLLEVLEHKHRLRVAPALPGVRPVDITSARLERVMKLGHGSHQRTPIWTWLVMLILGAVVLPGAAFVFAQEKERLPSLDGTPLKEAPKANKEKTKTQATSADDQEWAFKKIDVSSLLTELKKFDLKELTPEQRLLLEFPVREKCDALKLPAAVGNEHRFDLAGKPVQLGGSEPNFKIIDGQLYVFETTEIVDMISGTVESRQQSGFEQIVLSSTFSTIERDELKKLGGLTWSVASPSVPHASFASNSTMSASPERSKTVKQAALSTENGRNSSTVQSASYVEKNYPVFYSKIDKATAKQLSKQLSERKAQTVTSPRLMTLNGMQAYVFTGSMRPFVTGFVTDQSGKLGKTPQPIVSQFPGDGSVKTTFQPTLKPDDFINLKSQFEVWEIVGVETEELPIGGDTEPVHIQIPELSTQKINCSLDIKRNQTMVVGGFINNKAGKKSAFLAMVDCHVVFDPAPAKRYVAAAGIENPVSRHDMIVNVFNNEAGELLGYMEPIQISNSNAKANGAPQVNRVLHLEDANHKLQSSPPEIMVLSVTTKKKPSKPQDVSKLNETLLPLEFQIELDGELDVKVIEDTTFISGQDVVWAEKLSAEIKSPRFVLEAGLFEMEINPTKGLLKLSKGAKMQMDLMSIEGNDLTMNYSEETFKYEANQANLKNKGASAKADHIHFSEDSIILIGNVRMEGDLMENGNNLDIRANKVEIKDEEIFIEGVKQPSFKK